MIGVYKITNTKNGKVYIGQSVDIDKRFKQHKNLLRENRHDNYRLQDDWNTYGEDAFTFTILEKCRSAHLNEIEKYKIAEYDSTNEENGYNISAGYGRNLTVPSWYEGRGAFVKKYGMTPQNESAFYRNDVGEIEYNSLCAECSHICKQSFRADVLICPNLKPQ